MGERENEGERSNKLKRPLRQWDEEKCSWFGNISTSAICLDTQERSERKITLFQRQKQWYLDSVKNHTDLPCLCFCLFVLFCFVLMWTIFKVFIESVTLLHLFYVLGL